MIGDYARRLPWELQVREVAEGRDKSRRKTFEAEALIAAVSDRDILVALDEGGKSPTSEEFAAWLGARRDDGQRSIAFVIGGADGLDDSILSQASLKLLLGRMTWPHLLARLLLVEQIYRAHTILTGHPYHRA